MKLTDRQIFDAMDQAAEKWLSRYPEPAPEHSFSIKFERRINNMLNKNRRFPYKALIAAVMAALLGCGIIASADGDIWPPAGFHSAIPPKDGADYTISQAGDIEPVTSEHLALHNLPYSPELNEDVGYVDIYIGSEHEVDGYYGCEKHGDESHFVKVTEKLTVKRGICEVCGHKKLSYGVQTIETCLTEPDLSEFEFCESHARCESFEKTRDDFEGWEVCTPTEYTEWEEDRSYGSEGRTSPCTAHNHYGHDEVQQVRYAVTEYRCPDCPKVVPCVEVERRTVCYNLTEGLTYDYEP
ncbi:MAG: hypothetical protein IJD03_05665 [Clostridia bacterium]|nr:hypothetical protein [Clostridia bacterium]